MTLQLNLSTFEEKYPHFRSDELYFIRMASPYIEGIFWDVFNAKNRRKNLYSHVEQNLKPVDIIFLPRHCEARSNEAIQKSRHTSPSPDCRVSLSASSQ